MGDRGAVASRVCSRPDSRASDAGTFGGGPIAPSRAAANAAVTLSRNVNDGLAG